MPTRSSSTLALLLSFLPLLASAATNLVTNGSFEQTTFIRNIAVPTFWSAAGNASVKQELASATGRDGSRCVRLRCFEFSGDGPDVHAMIAQSGQVSVRARQWYRLTFWARAEAIHDGAVDVALNSTNPWENAGLSQAFNVTSEWQPYDLRFLATRDVAVNASRLQFWFKSTGALWLDDVVLTSSDVGQEWFPQISTSEVTNFVPNSSFECGTAGWGSYSYGIKGWAGNLFQLEGKLDAMHPQQHGTWAMKIALDSNTVPTFLWDYPNAAHQAVRQVLVANRGWFRVTPNEKLVLSAWLRGDANGLPAQMAVIQAPSALSRKEVTVTREWQRYSFSFTPTQPFLFIALGLDLDAAKRDAATLWIDSVQLERGETPTPYAPRSTVESFMQTPVPDNIFTNVEKGASFSIRSYNNGETPVEMDSRLFVTNFFEKLAHEGGYGGIVAPHSGITVGGTGLLKNVNGWFRAGWSWTATEKLETGRRAPKREPKKWAGTDFVRVAMLRSVEPLEDSPFGFNHAYPWDHLVASARRAGIVWWRDWSANWQSVEPQQGRFDFTGPDEQIARVLRQDARPVVLLPFPSAPWSTAADPQKIAAQDRSQRARLTMASAPKDLADFARYTAETVKHYRTFTTNNAARQVEYFQILNEPVYTSYALPRLLGYGLPDYLRLLESASRAAKAARPDCRIIGGISASVDAGLTRDFVTQGGLRWVDVLDLHTYAPPVNAESFEDSFSTLADLMRANGGSNTPIWMTEWGCYADDDPPAFPYIVGDAAMNRSRWPSEREATEHIVRFAAVSFAHGLRKIFFHAGTCGMINGPDAGGVLFEYGGTPRKMYSGVATLTEMLGVPDECVKIIRDGPRRAYVFRRKNVYVAIAWTRGERHSLNVTGDTQVIDIMGNRLTDRQMALTATPIYVIGKDLGALTDTLQK